jgi:RNA polymerase sigma factor (sigma-70 family)
MILADIQHSGLFWNGIDLHWAYAKLLPSISKKTQCAHYANDVLHDSLLRFALTSNPNRQQQPHAYLRTIVQHLINDEYHQSKRFDSFDALSELHFDVQAPTAPSTEFLADIKQRLAYVQNIIDNLPPRCRETFWLYRIEGFTQPVIAEKLGISKNMVERHMMRAIVDLTGAKELLMLE